MNTSLLILPIAAPAVLGILCLLMPGRRAQWLPSLIAVIASALQLALAILLFSTDLSLTIPWLGYGIELSLKLTRMSAFILLAIAGFSLLVSLYASSSLSGTRSQRQFFAWMLLTVAMASGAVLADNLVLFLVFWESLLLTLFGMIARAAAVPTVPRSRPSSSSGSPTSA